MTRSESFDDNGANSVHRYRARSLAAATVAGLLVGGGATAAYKELQSNPFELSTAIAVETDFSKTPDGMSLGATVAVDFSSPESVDVDDAINNIQSRFYADSSSHDAILNFDIPENMHAYKVQCFAVDIGSTALIQSGIISCDMRIYPDGFVPQDD